MTLKELSKKIEREKGKKLEVQSDIKKLKKSIKKKEKEFLILEKAHEIIKAVGKRTQEQLQFHIADITSLALSSIFDDPYKLVLKFEDRRGKTECDILFERDGNLLKPLDSSGGGVVDVASFALRIASWSMQTPRTRAFIMLDEPFKHLSQDKQEAASEMVKEVSRRLGIQFLIVTHETILATYADNGYRTTIKKGITKVT